MVHISPYHNDFLTLRPIQPCTVKRLGGSSVAAIGVGSIHIHIAKGATITLEDALYIPNAVVRLVSVSALAKQSNISSLFDDTSMKLINKSTGAVIAQESLLPNQRLYALDLSFMLTEHYAFMTSQAPDFETWHCHLRHAKYQTVMEMAKAGLIPGMPTAFPSKPPKCDSMYSW